jgi:hypothetical protein
MVKLSEYVPSDLAVHVPVTLRDPVIGADAQPIPKPDMSRFPVTAKHEDVTFQVPTTSPPQGETLAVAVQVEPPPAPPLPEVPPLATVPPLLLVPPDPPALLLVPPEPPLLPVVPPDLAAELPPDAVVVPPVLLGSGSEDFEHEVVATPTAATMNVNRVLFICESPSKIHRGRAGASVYVHGPQYICSFGPLLVTEIDRACLFLETWDAIHRMAYPRYSTQLPTSAEVVHLCSGSERSIPSGNSTFGTHLTHPCDELRRGSVRRDEEDVG